VVVVVVVVGDVNGDEGFVPLVHVHVHDHDHDDDDD